MGSGAAESVGRRAGRRCPLQASAGCSGLLRRRAHAAHSSAGGARGRGGRAGCAGGGKQHCGTATATGGGASRRGRRRATAPRPCPALSRCCWCGSPTAASEGRGAGGPVDARPTAWQAAWTPRRCMALATLPTQGPDTVPTSPPGPPCNRVLCSSRSCCQVRAASSRGSVQGDVRPTKRRPPPPPAAPTPPCCRNRAPQAHHARHQAREEDGLQADGGVQAAVVSGEVQSPGPLHAGLLELQPHPGCPDVSWGPTRRDGRVLWLRWQLCKVRRPQWAVPTRAWLGLLLGGPERCQMGGRWGVVVQDRVSKWGRRQPAVEPPSSTHMLVPPGPTGCCCCCIVAAEPCHPLGAYS